MRVKGEEIKVSCQGDVKGKDNWIRKTMILIKEK